MHNNEVVTPEEQTALMEAMRGDVSDAKKAQESTDAKRQGLIAELEGERDPRIIQAMLDYHKKLKGRT